MTTRKTKPATKPDKTTTPNPNEFRIEKVEGKSKERQFAEVGQDPTALNTITARIYSQKSMGEIDISESVNVMREKVGKLNAGDTQQLEATLTAQMVSLDAIFNELARRAALNMGEHLSATESYMRLALKSPGAMRPDC